MAEPSLGGVALPRGLEWIDEFPWTGVAQNVGMAVDGTLLVERGRYLAGRPITLRGGDDFGWIRKATLDAVHALAATGEPLRLVLEDGREFDVLFAHGSDPITARPLIPGRGNPGPDDWYVPAFKLITMAV